MTAQPTDPGAHRMWTPDTARQRLANYTIEDVLNLPDDAPRVELLDGVMIVVPSPTLGHQRIEFLLCQWFDAHAPREFTPTMATGVLVDDDLTLEPDVLLLHSHAVVLDRHFSTPDQVELVVEIVSKGTRRRDRFEKPALYGAAGVSYYWRIEQDPVHVFAYELVGDGSYRLVADTTEELVLEKPFEVRLPISEITP
jgi:Uma2 family endonuclease